MSPPPGEASFGVFGDAPYTDAEIERVDAVIDQINARPLEFVVHVGDIGSGSAACTDEWLLARKAQFARIRHRFILLPGDNEWSDCTKAKEEPGSDNDNVLTHPDLPLENLALIRQIFFAYPGWTLGLHPIQVISQANAYDHAFPADAQFVENVMWEQSKTVFVTINVPGGSNNDIDPWYAKTHTSPWNPDQQTEMDQRTSADVRWLNAAFALAEAGNAHSVVIVGQSDMWDTGDALGPSHQTNYEPIIAAMASNAVKYKKPVLYLNGDSHVYRSDNPLQQGSTCYTETNPCVGDGWLQHPYYDVPNFHRIVVHGSTFPMEWMKLSIDPRAAWENASTPTSWGPFSWQREAQTQLTP